MADSLTRETEGSTLSSRAWGAPFVLGLLMALVGVFAVFYSVLSGVVSVLLLGASLLVAGLFEIGHAIANWRESKPLASFLGGLLSGIVGLIFLVRPVAGLRALTLLLAGFFLVNGLFRGIIAVADRYPRWGFDLFYGVVAVALGGYVLANWPVSALWIVGTMIGLEIFFRGTSLMGASLAFRQVLRRPGRATAV